MNNELNEMFESYSNKVYEEQKAAFLEYSKKCFEKATEEHSPYCRVMFNCQKGNLHPKLAKELEEKGFNVSKAGACKVYELK